MSVLPNSFIHVQPAIGPIDLVVLQGTPFCNLNCSYCYLTKASRRDRSSLAIPAVQRIFAKILTSRFIGKTLNVSWHSGEPLVLSPSYYDAAIQSILDLKEELCPSDLTIQFDVQTNGTLIDQEWCDLFNVRREALSVGVSCDGPAWLHDAHRRNWAGRATHQETCRGMALLCDNGIKFDLIAVVSAESLNYPHEFYDFFCRYKDHVREFHFNLLDEFSLTTEDVAARDAYARKYSSFLKSLLEAITEVGAPADSIKIRNFSDFYARLFAETDVRLRYDTRSLSRPFKSLNIDVSGNVSTFYAGLTADESRQLYGDNQGLMLGNLLTHDLEDIAATAKLERIAADFETSHRACEVACDYYSLCSGGYNLIKHKRFGTFEATETPECFIHVKTFVDALLDHMDQETPKD